MQLFKNFQKIENIKGSILYLYGQILDTQGKPISNTKIEIWQTDNQGYYDHPRDSNTKARDKSFQFFGSTKSNNQGWYAFRTIIPGEYIPRPRHIHFKIKQSEKTLLTSQFYFSDDIKKLENEHMFKTVDKNSDALLLSLIEYENKIMAKGNIYIQFLKLNSKFDKTPSQAEGPFYPVQNLNNYDNDLLIL